MTSPHERIGIVTICYQSTEILANMLKTVPEGVPVVLVDNAAGTDDGALAELARRSGAHLISNTRNKGFGVACNQGAAHLETEFLLFLNPDTLLTPDALEQLVAAADKYPNAVAFNPRLTSPSGAPQFKRNSHLFPKSEKMARGWPETDSEVTVLSGAALMVRHDAFDRIGGFDPAIFLYHEDDDLALSLRRAGGKLMFVRDALVEHMQGRSSVRSSEIARLKAWHMGRSRVYATRKHGRPAPFARAVFSALRQLLSPAILLSKRKRAKQTAYLKGVLSTYRDGGATSVDYQ